MAASEPEILNTAISRLQDSINLALDGDSDKLVCLSNLGAALATRFTRLGKLSDLERAIQVHHQTVDLTPDDHPSKPGRLNNLGGALVTRFNRFGRLDDLEGTIMVGRQAVGLAPDGHPHKPAWLNNLGIALRTCFNRRGQLNDLEEAIMPSWLNNLGNALRTRFSRLGQLNDLEESITIMRQAADLTPDGHPNKPTWLSNLGITLETRFNRLGQLNDLEEAIVVKRQAVDFTSDDHPDKLIYLNNLGIALHIRFKRLGQLNNLEDAITTKRRAVDLTPDDHPDKPARLSNLGNALEIRFDHLGQLNDLEEAIVVNRRAVDLTPDGHPDKPTWLNNLGCTLDTRFKRLGQLNDLKDAIMVEHQAIDLTPDGHPDKPNRLTCFDRLGQLNDLQEAIMVNRRAVDLTPDGNPDKPSRLSNLGNALETRFDCLGQLNDLQEAIAFNRRAVELTPDDHPDKLACLNNLGNALRTRFGRFGQLNDLEEAVTVTRQAVDLIPDGHTDKPGCLNNLGHALQTRFGQTHNPEDLELACDAFASAINQETGPPSVRFDAVKGYTYVRRTQIQLGRATYQDLMDTFNRAFNLIPQVAWLGTSVSQRYTVLSSIGEVVNDAVSVAIQTGNLPHAIEWLDEGRSVVWGQLLQLRSPVDDLRSHHPDLADRLQSLSHDLEASGNEISDPDITVRDMVSVRIELAQDYQDLLRHIREQDGFKSFLLPKTLVELIPPRRTDGPVVVINVHWSRCDALVVYGSAEPIVHVPLPNLTSKFAENMRLCFTQSLREARVRKREGADGEAVDSASPDHRGAIPFKYRVDSLIAGVLKDLWLRIVQPVLERIEEKLVDFAVTGLPHVTWCPTGPLAFLPIHAAGIYGRRGMPDGGMKLFDIVVSSYTPTLSALLRPPRMFVDGWPSFKALVVSQPKTPGMSMLPGVASEVVNIRKHLDGQIEHFDDKDATVEAVLRAMNDDYCQLIHLACHGIQNTVDPTESAFALYDGHLTLSQLMSSSVRNAELAFLSACETSTGDEKLPEEAVHLAAGMLAVGCRSVIGTMWSIGDKDAPIVADEVYRRLKEGYVPGDGRLNTAQALHAAVKVLREEVGESNIVRWAPYVHFGV
ncbi:CHAT domain-containing protein [Vararia minispora EC-137]|uniref:CHAT domain-containing protein n=1 Tax=Vararia minispora EC-137 TaxID=1314806 RepID=A0ACB8QEM7_9AGAM|nr:CHAT domain-containing protein [Vararia minispora EC-137]